MEFHRHDMIHAKQFRLATYDWPSIVKTGSNNNKENNKNTNWLTELRFALEAKTLQFSRCLIALVSIDDWILLDLNLRHNEWDKKKSHQITLPIRYDIVIVVPFNTIEFYPIHCRCRVVVVWFSMLHCHGFSCCLGIFQCKNLIRDLYGKFVPSFAVDELSRVCVWMKFYSYNSSQFQFVVWTNYCCCLSFQLFSIRFLSKQLSFKL